MSVKNTDTSCPGTVIIDVTRKSPALYITIFGFWLLILILCVPALWQTFILLNSIPARVLFILCVPCLTLFWFFGSYHLVFLIFAYLRRPALEKRSRLLPQNGHSPKVALLYTTYNDFNREAVATLLKQDYPDYHVFILDVSTNPERRKEVDAFVQHSAPGTTLVRLQPRLGFKARTLNDSLKNYIGAGYSFFAVCDADNRLPPDFLKRIIPYFSLDNRIGFVQANHRASKLSEEKFCRDFEVAVDASWYLHQLPRDKYGLVMCMGHGVVVRREAWEKVGGYPEIVQEDTAFTMRLRENGYFGCFAPEVVSVEDFPEDFRRFRRRQYRLIQADTEILSTQMPAFLRAKGITFIEKLDLLARTLRLPSQCVALPFLLLLAILLPLSGNGWLLPNPIDTVFRSMLSTRVVIVSLLLASAPLFSFFVYFFRKPFNPLPLLFRAVTIHYAIISVTFISFWVFVLRGKAMFVVTGSQESGAIQEQAQRGFKRFLQRVNTESPVVWTTDLIAGLALASLGILSWSLTFVGIGLVLLLSPAIRRFRWGNPLIQALVFLPLFLMLTGLVGSYTGFGTQSQYLALAVLSILLF